MRLDAATNDVDLIRLLLRAGPFAVARPDIAVSPLPGGQEVGAYHSFSDKKGGEPFLVTSFRVSTIGGLVRMWDNFTDLPCPSCGGKSVIVDFGGSFLSGAGKFSKWFCPACGETFSKTPKGGVAQLGEMLEQASRTWALVRPSPDDATPVLPGKLQPDDLKPLFGGALLEAYATCAVDALRALDAEAADAARAGKAFHATFRIDAGDGVEGDVVFANVAGHAQIFRPGEDRPEASVPVEWDECFGLWPTLYAAAERLSEIGKPKDS